MSFIGREIAQHWQLGKCCDYAVTTGETTCDHMTENAETQLFLTLQKALFQGLVNYRASSAKNSVDGQR